MTPKIFITGTTGYTGGDALYTLYHAHPDWEFTALVRNSDRGAPVAAAFPKVHLVYGTLEDAKILEEEAAKADVVLHTADSSDHEIAARAIATGLARGHTPSNPGYWLHLSGTGILCWKDMESQTYGEAPSQPPYDDLDNVSQLTHLPDSAFHRDIDKLVLSAGSSSLKTAIVCPPTIYGPGRGPGNQRSRQVYNLVRITLQKGQAPNSAKVSPNGTTCTCTISALSFSSSPSAPSQAPHPTTRKSGTRKVISSPRTVTMSGANSPSKSARSRSRKVSSPLKKSRAWMSKKRRSWRASKPFPGVEL
ncbi:hypothetical protein H4I95_10009 [Botrytis cinerea]